MQPEKLPPTYLQGISMRPEAKFGARRLRFTPMRLTRQARLKQPLEPVSVNAAK